jgi:hypothetical protein
VMRVADSATAFSMTSVEPKRKRLFLARVIIFKEFSARGGFGR